MDAIAQRGSQWLRRRLAWSNTPQAWAERAGLVALLAVPVVILWYSADLSLSQQVVCWGSWLVCVAILLRHGWLKLFGPVLFYDLVRLARRRRYIALRCLYAIGLTLLLCWVYLMWNLRLRYDQPTRISDQAQLAEYFFFALMVVQSVLVVILTPAYTAGAIAEEKDRKTLEFLLATDLRNREIVLSKLVARLANMTLILLTGLPILSLTQFFGGIDPDLLIASFAGLGLTMLSLAALSIFMSVYAKRPRDAIVLTYLAAAAYLGLSALSLMVRLVPGVPGWGISVGFLSVTVTDLINWFNSGNLFVALGRLGSTWGQVPLAETLPGILRDYAIFHGLVTVTCGGLAVSRLRAVALKQSHGKAQKAPLSARLIGRPRIGIYPMLWKEIFAEPGLRLNWLGRIILGVLVLGSFIPGVWIIVEFFLESMGLSPAPYYRWRTPFEALQEGMNIWVRSVGTIVACLTLLGVAVRAGSSISGERDRQTFDGLLTTPLSGQAILLAKWLGSIASVRWSWLWLLAIWALAVVTMGMTPLAVPLLVLAWLIYAAVFAGIGLWCSMTSRTTLRATMWTLVGVMLLSVGHWMLMGMCCYLPISALSRGRTDVEGLLKLEAGQTPPFVLGWLALHGGEFTQGGKMYMREAGDWMAVSLLGLFCWAVLALVLWVIISVRFQAVANRQSLRPPQPLWPPPSRARPIPQEPPLDVIPVLADGEAAPAAERPQLRGAIEILDERPGHKRNDA